ncbi:mitochondrial aldehyde dehydrogenase [Lecanicillium sp. MT-2017a]|nr:mitochondrial aldehyde dehydrogenase [Lecanicillium sp. MT-2017a]
MSLLFHDLQTPNGHKYSQPIGLFINNEFIASTSAAAIESIDPATEETIASVHAAGKQDIDKAVNSARKALAHPSWKDLSGTDRGRLLSNLAGLIEEYKEVLASIDAWDSAWKLAPALACGNTVVLKASEFTPLSILKLGELVMQAGFPSGVMNLVNGLGAVAGTELVLHPGVDKISFTGSTATARRIMEAAAGTLKQLTIEAGGKSPLLVFNDADLEEAVKWSHLGIMSNQGQICSATSRILVQDDIHDSFVKSFTDAVRRVSKLGNQWDKETYQGPQVSKAQYDRVLSYIAAGKEEGAELILGGEPVAGRGFFISPAVFINVTEEMRIYQEEIFGPVVVISRFSTEEEAVARANNTAYGLGAAIFTKDIKRGHLLASAIDAGTVWINSSQDLDIRVPFGGFKQSGFGRELSEAALQAYSQVKAIHINLE